jgi:mono/diheme cytochrome c family protein
VDAGTFAPFDSSAPSAPSASALRDAQIALAADAKVVVQGRPGFCSRPGGDAIRELFCADVPPDIRSLRDLTVLLGLTQGPQTVASEPAYDLDAATPDAAYGAGSDASYGAGSDASYTQSLDDSTIVDGVIVLGHSTALSGHLVSPINPRAIVLGRGTIMTYQRGVQQIELVTSNRDRGGFAFFLLSFRQACNDREGGCTPGDLYTPRIESSWTAVSIRDDEELKNTPLDCRQCHQRGRGLPMLLMRELQGPWTHFFEPAPIHAAEQLLPGVRGRDLVEDYLHAKGDEPYGGVAADTLRHTVGFVLQNLVPRDQPLIFDSPAIEDERFPFDGTGYPSAPLPSPTWLRGYEAFKRGEQLALPYFDARPADPQKLAHVSEAYRQYRAGKLSADALPDLSDVFPDDPLVRAQIGLQTEPDATPAEALVQACGSCHNDVLDQTISRARFNIDLKRMRRDELDLAIERIGLAPGAAGVMPPPEGRQLDAAGRARVISYLRDNQRSSEDDALLTRAATLGMTGGGVP